MRSPAILKSFVIVTLPIQCATCHGAVTLQLAAWPPDQPIPQTQAWVCPYCFSKNEGGFPGRLAWVTRRYAYGVPQ